MSKLLDYGMSVAQTVACVTFNASRVFPIFKNRGTLKVGAPADVALLELREGNFEFQDNYNNKITGRQRLFPSGTVLGGKKVQGGWGLGTNVRMLPAAGQMPPATRGPGAARRRFRRESFAWRGHRGLR